MELPRTLHGQLYLLAYDKKRRRFDYDTGRSYNPQWQFEFALRSAMLADLYLAGYVGDRDGEAALLKGQHDDPLLNQALTRAPGKPWFELVYSGGRTCRDVFEQLEAAGWIRGKHRRLLGFAAARSDVYDEDMIDVLAGGVTAALRTVLANRPADPRTLAVGLIAFQARLPMMSNFRNDTDIRDRLREINLAAIEPVQALWHAIKFRRIGTGVSGS